MTACNGCGGCCDPVALPYTQDEARRVMPGDPSQRALFHAENRRFVLEDLRPLPRKEGLRRAGYFTEGGVSICRDERTSEIVLVYTHFFECIHYDPETRQCRNYENRPSMCEGYPWYGAPPDATKAIPLECSFRADVGQPVLLTKKPSSVS